MSLLESSYTVAKQMLDIITRSSRTGVLRFRITKTQFFGGNFQIFFLALEHFLNFFFRGMVGGGE